MENKYTAWPKKFGTIILYALTLPNINRFSKLFHNQNQEKISNNAITKDPTKRQVCRYTTLWNVGFSLIALWSAASPAECVVQQQGVHIERLM